MTIDDKLNKLKYNCDTVSHLNPNITLCKECKSKICVNVCPANVYEWDEENQTLIVNYENCLECGACKIICEKSCLKWEYPKTGKGVTFKYG